MDRKEVIKDLKTFSSRMHLAKNLPKKVFPDSESPKIKKALFKEPFSIRDEISLS